MVISERSRSLAALIAIGIGIIVVYTLNPSETPLIPCYFYKITGLQCAGCGMTRAGHHLLHGNLMTAWNFNPLIFVTVAAIGYWGMRSLLKVWWGKHLPGIRIPVWAYILLSVGVLGFTLSRNIENIDKICKLF